MNVADPRCARLSALSEIASRLGLAFGEAVEGAADMAGKLEYFQLFDRCFFGVRMATALELRLRREALAGRAGEGASELERPERERAERAEAPDCETDGGDDRERRDREREREAEPASLPVLLATLEGVAADAAALPGPEPADLPALREQLARIGPDARPRPGPKLAPNLTKGADLRARLAGSGAAVTLPLALKPAAKPVRSAVGLALRRATGPPRR